MATSTARGGTNTEQFATQTRYDASQAESKWYARWEGAGLFAPDSDTSKPVYSITIPPPNITGSLHMGHALCYPLQDCWAGISVCVGSAFILPGQDHAGIATQSVVDKQLRKEGSSAAQIGREKFVERVWEWRRSLATPSCTSFGRSGAPSTGPGGGSRWMKYARRCSRCSSSGSSAD